MAKRKLPDKEKLIKILSFLIDVHPIKPIRTVSLVFIYMGLLEHYPDIVSYNEFNTISKRKKTPEQIAEAILLIWRRQASDI